MEFFMTNIYKHNALKFFLPDGYVDDQQRLHPQSELAGESSPVEKNAVQSLKLFYFSDNY